MFFALTVKGSVAVRSNDFKKLRLLFIWSIFNQYIIPIFCKLNISKLSGKKKFAGLNMGT
jgi:hypothetical protein